MDPDPYFDRETLNWVFKYKEVFDPWDLYLFMREWFIEEGWVERDEMKFQEVLYIQKETTAGTDIWYWWRFDKIQNSFYAYHFMVDTHILFLKPHELVVNGKKIKMYHGEIEFTVRGRLKLDHAGKWRKHWLLKHLVKWPFIERIFKRDIDYQILKLAREGYKLQDFLKSYFKMTGFEKDREDRFFFPKQSGVVY